MALPKVSVFMQTYQHAAFVRESVDSVLAQGYPNLEIVIGDDASTDGTQEILLQYDGAHPGLFKVLLSNSNLGITANSNRVFRACTGEFLAHTSGDDVWLPGKLHKQVEWFSRHPQAVVCYGNAEHINEDGTRVLRLHHEARRNPFRSGGIEAFLSSTVFFPACTAMVRRSACPPYGFEPSVTWNSDWLYYAEIVRQGEIGYIPEVLARYRVHSASAMRNLDRVLADALLSCAILESRHPEYMPRLRHLRQEFLTGSALQYLKTRDYETAARYLLVAIPLDWSGDTYLSRLQKALIYLVVKTGLLRFVYERYDSFQTRRTAERNA
jgi:glycosyltransferase involved in cell wall biosynthesis